MTEEQLEHLEEFMNGYGIMAIKAGEKFLHGKGATSVYVRVSSHFHFGGELCDGPYAMLRASFKFTRKELEEMLSDELTRITIKRYDVPGFNDGQFQGTADLMYSYKKDRAYFFGG